MSSETSPITQDNKVRVAWVGLGFTAFVHTILVAAFIANLAAGQSVNTDAIAELRKEQSNRAQSYYAVGYLEKQLAELSREIRDIKRLLKSR